MKCIDINHENLISTININGDLHARNAKQHMLELSKTIFKPGQEIHIDFEKAGHLDKTILGVIAEALEQWREQSHVCILQNASPLSLKSINSFTSNPHYQAFTQEQQDFTTSKDEKILNIIKISLNDMAALISFLGYFFITLVICIIKPTNFRLSAISSVIYRAGLRALPIVGLMSALIGVVMVFQGSAQLKRMGAEIFTVDLVAMSFMREIGVLFTSILVAGRSGSAFAAQIGSMKINQEIDALKTFDLEPMRVLVIPRVLGLVIALPLLVFFADLMGLIGAAIMTDLVLDISYGQFLDRLSIAVTPRTMWVGVLKAPVFGFIIAIIGCFEGFQVKRGASDVGIKTTKSVVLAIFIVIVADALFAVLFTKMGI